jgi:hypothetical protein
MQQNHTRAAAVDFVVECRTNHGIVLAESVGRR